MRGLSAWEPPSDPAKPGLPARCDKGLLRDDGVVAQCPGLSCQPPFAWGSSMTRLAPLRASTAVLARAISRPSSQLSLPHGRKVLPCVGTRGGDDVLAAGCPAASPGCPALRPKRGGRQPRSCGDEAVDK